MTRAVEDWSILALHVNARRGRDNPAKPDEPDEPDDLEFSVGGLTEPDGDKVRHHFRWPRRGLRVGSTVKITLLDVNECDPPTSAIAPTAKFKSVPTPIEEMREFRRKDYLELKKEFEGNADG
ncbi:MAG: hypothetical protein IPJ21_20140 [Sterolibacteriaceae bacterium]|nr:hypothetical protein [Sterolibacteriaceae bacterium]